LPDTVCDVVIELVDNAFRRRYDARLLDFKVKSPSLSPDESSLAPTSIKSSHLANIKILDLRGRDVSALDHQLSATICDRCPQSWQDLQTIIDRAHQTDQALALVYPNPEKINGAIAWQTLVGIAKYLSRTGKQIRRSQLTTKLGIEDQAVLQIGFEQLQQYGYTVHFVNEQNDQLDNLEQKICINLISSSSLTNKGDATIAPQFIQAANEVIFQQQFFDRQLLPSQ
jgi:single-stranded-DNA-specific exonuclease